LKGAPEKCLLNCFKANNFNFVDACLCYGQGAARWFAATPIR